MLYLVRGKEYYFILSHLVVYLFTPCLWPKGNPKLVPSFPSPPFYLSNCSERRVQLRTHPWSSALGQASQASSAAPGSLPATPGPDPPPKGLASANGKFVFVCFSMNLNPIPFLYKNKKRKLASQPDFASPTTEKDHSKWAAMLVWSGRTKDL